ncbi:MAG: hypothetical protein M5R42_20570 [Rhodocyclaceae bacterium]|nr:hypothetical protein [Rhodocyclaceae bacterium]
MSSFRKEEQIQEAWRLYHQGEFQQACELGLSLGLPGYAVANKAATIYATYLENNEKKKLALFEEAAARGEEQMAAMPKYANAFTSTPWRSAATARVFPWRRRWRRASARRCVTA